MPNKVYRVQETAITWRNTGGTAALTLTSVASSAGRQGALYDGGTSARSRRYSWRAWVKFATTPVVGDRVDIYIKTSDGTSADNNDGTGDAAVSASNKLRNLQWIGAIIVDQASTTALMVKSGDIEISARYFAPVFFNSTTVALSSTASDHGFDLVPVPDEIQ